MVVARASMLRRDVGDEPRAPRRRAEKESAPAKTSGAKKHRPAGGADGRRS